MVLCENDLQATSAKAESSMSVRGEALWRVEFGADVNLS